MAKITQCDRIIQYIQDFGYITAYQAYTDLGVTQLGARIYNLKQKGFKFKTERVKDTNRYGETVYYDKYMLIDEVA